MRLRRSAALAITLGFACALMGGLFATPTLASKVLYFVGATLGSPGRGEPRPYDGIAASAPPQPFVLQGQQERPGVPQGAPPATFSITRHGKIVFEADVREPDSPRVVLTESIEVGGIKSPQGWTDFISAFVKATSQEWLSLISPSVAQKKGKVTIAFALRRDGSLEGALSVPKSSGDSAIDDATRVAIAKSAPFHELPSSFLGGVAQFRVTFVYNRPHPLPPLSARASGSAKATGAAP